MESATLIINEKKLDIKLMQEVDGKVMLDGRDLYENTGVKFYDPGLKSTIICDSVITYVDGEQGRLFYQGHPIEHLVNQYSYLEVCYLLLFSVLPSQDEMALFQSEVMSHSLLHEQFRMFFNGFPRDSHPMAIMVAAVGALSAFYGRSSDLYLAEDRELLQLRILGKMPTIAAMSYRYVQGLPFIYPAAYFSYAENILHMMFDMPNREAEFTPLMIKALDAFLVLHADHEQNASTTAVRVAASTGANPYACISSGITALWGPSHGGASEAVLNQLESIGSVSKVPSFIKKVKAKEVRLMGFGHRVYKNYDPRCAIIKNIYHELSEELGADPLYAVALALEDIALNDVYFQERFLYPNVDFYSGLVLKAIGIPKNMFTVMFALGRTVGWLAHLVEQADRHPGLLLRPHQNYLGGIDLHEEH